MTIHEDNFTEFVSYNEYGGVERKIGRDYLVSVVEQHLKDRRPVWGVWQMRWDPYEANKINVRVLPENDIGKMNWDNATWDSWLFDFVPYIP